MSNFNTFRSNEDELTSSSDEKMDTGSESFRSQDTPNSPQSDFEDPENVLRLQNPESQVLNLVQKMSILNLETKDSPKFGITPPRISSTLTLTTNHPLMATGSPEEFPDLIPKKLLKLEEEKDLSLSSIEDDRVSDMNGFYSPQRNTSKNNLYFNENFVTADSQTLGESLDLAPDVARVSGRRNIIPSLDVNTATPPQRISDRMIIGDNQQFAIKITSHSTPVCPVDIEKEEFHTGVAEWCESPSQLRAMPNFELPIEMSSAIGMHDVSVIEDPDTPDVLSTSTQEEKSAYQALLDPYTGSVALRHTRPQVQHQTTQRRKIQLPPDDDQCSLDSVSVSSIESEEEPPELEPRLEHQDDDQEGRAFSDDDDTKRSKSTNTISYSSEPIPEYSMCEELSNERGWISVPRAGHNLTCDVKVIEPFKRVLSHGGYSGAGAALVVFSACHLPDTRRPDYTYVMDNLFLYVVWTLERLVTEEYEVVYLHGAGHGRVPGLHWLHDCYRLVDRRLRKSLKHFYLVHPTFWLKSFVVLTKPFISSKFFKKLSYVDNLDQLMQQVPVDPNAIPEIVKQYDLNKKR